MTAQQFVDYNLHKGEEFGIKGYQCAHTNALDKPQMKNIVKGKRTTYLDDAVKAKKFIPPAHYKVAGNMINKKKT